MVTLRKPLGLQIIGERTMFRSGILRSTTKKKLPSRLNDSSVTVAWSASIWRNQHVQCILCGLPLWKNSSWKWELISRASHMEWWSLHHICCWLLTGTAAHRRPRANCICTASEREGLWGSFLSLTYPSSQLLPHFSKQLNSHFVLYCLIYVLYNAYTSSTLQIVIVWYVACITPHVSLAFVLFDVAQRFEMGPAAPAYCVLGWGIVNFNSKLRWTMIISLWYIAGYTMLT